MMKSGTNNNSEAEVRVKVRKVRAVKAKRNLSKSSGVNSSPKSYKSRERSNSGNERSLKMIKY